MNTCPNCGKVAGLHSSILQGCMCQYSMQAPPKRIWVGLTVDEIEELFQSAAGADEGTIFRFAAALQAKLKERNT